MQMIEIRDLHFCGACGRLITEDEMFDVPRDGLVFHTGDCPEHKDLPVIRGHNINQLELFPGEFGDNENN
jgi:hypothetical protein